MQTLPLDFTADDTLAGFRLHRFEVLNWGTFTHRVWTINPGGHNGLLTGDIGSGKSTLVDAITTLLVPHNRIVYNKAAGAVGRERDLYSYIRGEYKSEKDDTTQAAKAINLRGEDTFTVLLAHFHNEGFNQGASLAQVFWLKDQKRNPERFFVVAETPLTIAGHFSDFGSDILDLKKRLKRLKRVTVLDNFKEYSSRFRYLFGIQNEQALELFYQTVSMKSVGNLTDFVRNHMLEGADMESRIDALRRNFDNLNRAHEAVLKAKRQIERLTPLVEDGEQYRALAAEIENLRACREALAPWFAELKVQLLAADIDRTDLEVEKTASRLVSVREELLRLRRREGELLTGIDDSGGRRLQALADEIAGLSRERDDKLRKEEEYRRLALAVGLKPAGSEQDFFRNRRESGILLDRLTRESEELKKREIDLGVELRGLAAEQDSLGNEIESLRPLPAHGPGYFAGIPPPVGTGRRRQAVRRRSFQP
ncbi:MAG TPA: ATP-binding protein [Geobacteraceae bacterium]|nr:ATP-binding protein [Geobacteraceae bacterium]